MGFREVTMLEIKEVLRRWLRGEGKSETPGSAGWRAERYAAT